MSKLVLQITFALIFCVAVGNCLSPPLITCYSKHYQFLLRPGQSTKLTGLCMLAKCQPNGHIAYVGCSELVLDSLCTPYFGGIINNVNMAYPECCRPIIICE